MNKVHIANIVPAQGAKSTCKVCRYWKGMVNIMEKITFVPDGEEPVEFYVLEQTTIAGVNYILVTDAEEDEEGEAYILKDVSDSESEERVYSMVEDDNEFEAVSAVFENILEDIDLI